MGVPLEAKGHQLLGVLWVETVVAFSVIGLRWFTRKYIGGSIGLDDYILISSWVFMASFAAMCSASVSYGMGIHAKDLDIDDEANGILMLLVGQFTVSLAMGLSKCAVAVFLMRIVTQLWQKLVLWFWITTMMGWSCFLAISVFAQCTPVKSIWDPRVKQDHCTLSLTVIAKITCSWSAAMDFFLAAFPWIVLWKLNMKRKEKITICISLSLGVFAGVCGVVRTAGLDALSETSDYLYAVSDSVMWTSSELTLTIICICMPALRPLYNRLKGGSSTGGPYQQYDNRKTATRATGTASNDYNLKSMDRSKVDPNQYEWEVVRSPRHEDNSSDTFILHDQDKTAIHRQDEVTISYEDGISATSTKQHV